MIFMGVYEEISGQAVSFGQWMIWATPDHFSNATDCCFWITRDLKERSQIILPTLDPISVAEKRVLIIFSLTAFAGSQGQVHSGMVRLVDFPTRTMQWSHSLPLFFFLLFPMGDRQNKR